MNCWQTYCALNDESGNTSEPPSANIRRYYCGAVIHPTSVSRQGKCKHLASCRTSGRTYVMTKKKVEQTEDKLRGLSPRANYTVRATASCRRT
jgi:hypothetical protein